MPIISPSSGTIKFRAQVNIVLYATDVDDAIFRLAMHLLEVSRGSESELDCYQVGQSNIMVQPIYDTDR